MIKFFLPHLKNYLNALLPAARKWWQDKHADDAAALAFYSLISLVPLLLVSVWTAALVVTEETAKNVILEEATRYAGKMVAEYFGTMLYSEIEWAGSKLSPILAGIIIVFSATKMLHELRASLGKVFGRCEKIKKKFYATVLSRLVSLFIMLSLGLIIISAVAVKTIISIMARTVPEGSFWLPVIEWLSPTTSFFGVAILATFTMRWLPEKRPKFAEAFAGGFISAFLMLLLKYGVVLTIQHTEIGNYYGSAFTLALVLFWVYFTMQVFLYGAEYAAELSRRKGTLPIAKTKPEIRN